MDSSISSLLICCFIWTTLYFTLCLLNPKRSYEWHIRSVTLIHAVVIVSLAAWCVLVQGPWPFDHGGEASTPFQHFIITLCLAYFLLDFSWCMYYGTEGPVMLLHHTLSIAGLTTCVVLNWWGTEMVTTLFGAEITNPLLQLRWFLRETGNYHTFLGDLVDIAFMVLFGFFRIVLGSMLLYSYYQLNTDWWGRFGGSAIYGIGWIFWLSIVQYAFKKYSKRYVAWKSKKADKTKEENGNVVKDKLGNSAANVNGVVHKRNVNGGVEKYMETSEAVIQG